MERFTFVIIDDNPDDRSLVIRDLQRTFHNMHAEEVADPAAFEIRLRGPSPHLVITDYQLNWSDGLTVLRRLKHQWPDCPVIMFTGTGSEEIAVEAMKRGLDDYVLKSPKHFARLAAAAQMVLKMGRQKRDIKEAESRYKTLFESVPIGLYRLTPTGQFLDVNSALVSMLGFASRPALMRRGLPELHRDKSDFAKWREMMERTGEVRHFEIQLIRNDGQICWVDNTGAVVRDPATKQIFYEGAMEDITYRKLAEADREKLIAQLRSAIGRVKTLSGLLPICSSCKKIRDDHGYWNQIEIYIQNHSNAEFTHSFCPDCVKQLYPEVTIHPRE